MSVSSFSRTGTCLTQQGVKSEAFQDSSVLWVDPWQSQPRTGAIAEGVKLYGDKEWVKPYGDEQQQKPQQ